MDDNGQIAAEYLFIFIISLIIITLCFLPLISLSLDYTMDSTNVYNTKVELTRIQKGLNEVTVTGSGSKRTVLLNMPEDTVLTVKDSSLKAYVVLSDNTVKEIKLDTLNNDLNRNIPLKKGYNRLVISWQSDSSSIDMYID